MWKHLLGYALAAFFGSAIGGIVGAATIPIFNPQQLQIPETGNDFNTLINSINGAVVLAGPGGAFGGTGLISGAFSINQQPPSSPNVDGIQVVGAPAGGTPAANGVQAAGPTIAAIGSDANINIGLDPQGNGLVQFVGANQWIQSNTLTLCPGYATGATTPVTGGSMLRPAPTISGYLVVLDWRNQPHAIPTC